ncbi:MAG TPA: PD-(D/E)XK nuclease family protein [Solirubrobacteraceae bacterium]|nr:PD-(D/E)XK nuclease family protein [Solirubrobacteraceae bacterium]
MSLRLISGPANAGKAQAVMGAVRAELAAGRQPLLVVPTAADVQRYTRELAGDGALIGARVTRFGGLLGEVVRRAGADGPVLSERARERLIALVSRRAGLAAAGEQPLSGGLSRAVGELVDELHADAVTPARLQAALAKLDGGTPAEASSRRRLAELYSEYEAELARLGVPDAIQRRLRALRQIRAEPSLWGGKPVLLYGFDDLSPLQLEAVRTLAGTGAPVTVSLSFEEGRTAFAGRAATYEALAPLAAEHRRLAAREDYYAPAARRALGHLERHLFEPDAPRVPAGGAVRLLEGAGERAELELVAGEISRLLADGVAPAEIAVAIRGGGVSRELLGEVLARAGVPAAIQRPVPLGDSAIGRALIGLLRCVPRAGDAAPPGTSADLLAWLRAPGLLRVPALADDLERELRREGTTAVSRARALWEQRNWPLEALDELQAAQARSAAALIDRCGRELVRLLSAPLQGTATVLAGERADEGLAHAAAARALRELRELAVRAPELAPLDAPALAGELVAVEFLGGHPPGSDTVAVLDPLALRARRVRVLFLCGMQEGVFPSQRRRRGLLSDEDRFELERLAGIRLGGTEDPLAAERYLLYAAVSRPEELLVLSWHLADDEGLATSRSLFVEDVCDLFEEELLDRPLRGGAQATPPRSPAAPAGTDDEGRERPLRDEQVLAELAGRPWSASQLEKYIGCPMRWYIERILRPASWDPDAEPLRRGGLAHAALKDTLEGLRERTGSAAITPATLATARELLARALARRESEHPLSVSAERLPGARLRLHMDLGRYLEHAARAEWPLEPGPLELSFGLPGEEEGDLELPAFELGDGVVLRGRIDRVDYSPAGDAVVVDYKSGTATLPSRWMGEGKVQVPLYMLAVERLLERTAVGGFYQPLSGGDLRARGIVDEDTGIDLGCVRNDERPGDEVRELLGEALAMARSAAVRARNGELEPKPETCSPGGGCSYPSICRCR